MKRIPIVNRTAIYQRVAQGAIPITYSSCNLCKECKDCSGYKYESPEQSLELSAPSYKYRKIVIDKDFSDWDNLETTLRVMNLLKTNVRLITEKPLPEIVLWRLSYSPLNIVQININLLELTSFGWVGGVLSVANKCGVYTVLFMNPLVPTITKTYHIIELIDNFKNLGNHVALKFIQLPNLPEIEGYVNFNGTAISLKHLRKTELGYSCNPEYINKFMEVIRAYTTPRKISVSICDTGEDCTGLGLEE